MHLPFLMNSGQLILLDIPCKIFAVLIIIDLSSIKIVKKVPIYQI